MFRHPRKNQTFVLWFVLLLGLLIAPTQARAADPLSPLDQHIYLPTIHMGVAQVAGSGGNGSSDNDPVKLAWFYKPPTTGDLNTLAETFDSFVLTKNDEDERDELRAQGVQGPFLQYLRFEAIMDPGSCTAQPWRNQVADRPGDFCSISSDHPDWFLYDANNNRIYDQEGSARFYLMDPANQGWRAFWLDRARESQETLEWDGVFLDNVEASLSKRERLGNLPASYPTDATYQAAIEGFLSYIYTSYFQPQGRPLQANVIELRETETWFSYLQYLDGAMEEGWGVDWSNGFLPLSYWEEHLARVEQTEATGKQAILVSQGDQGNESRQSFAFASYLLVTSGNSSFRYTDSSAYGDIWLYDDYNVDLGAPLGPRYQDGTNWKRDFANGTVTVNPTSHTATIDAPQQQQRVTADARAGR